MAEVPDDAAPYEIPMMGLGLFACRREAWLGFNPEFRGFGGEEGYIHEKYRQAGRKTLCLPFLKWLHYFHTRDGKVTAPYAPQLADKVHNYEVGFAELGLDPAPMRQHLGVSARPRITNIQIDPNANCGSKCWYCPVAYKERPLRQLMPQETFEKILDRIQEGVRDGAVAANFTLWLSSYNDILLDPLLEQRLAALRERKMKFAVLTNGIALGGCIDLLHEYRDVAACYLVNLPAGSSEAYERLTGNPAELFPEIIDGLKALHAKDPAHYTSLIAVGVNGMLDDDWCRRQVKVQLPIGDNDAQLVGLKKLLPMFPRVETARPLCDRAGHLAPFAIDNGVHKENPAGCNRLTEWLHINTFGQIYTCCQDYAEETVYGSVVETPIKGLLEELARSKGKAMELCRRCVFSG
jgi:hypothetical protein